MVWTGGTMIDDRDFKRPLEPGAEPRPLYPIRMASYRDMMKPVLDRLAADANPEVRALGERLIRCLNCPGDRKCEGCPLLGLP